MVRTRWTVRQRSRRPAATSWDKLSAQEVGDSLANRDVHSHQQLDRTPWQARRTATPGHILAGVLGILVAVTAWVAFSGIAVALVSVGTLLSGGLTGGDSPAAYYTETTTTGAGGQVVACYKPLTENGRPDLGGPCYRSVEEVPVPAWWLAAQTEEAPDGTAEQAAIGTTFAAQLASVSLFKLFLTAGPGLVMMLAIGSWFSRQALKFNARIDHRDINDHHGDQHIQLPEEIQRTFDWFPDAGAHCSVQVSSMVSHMMLQRKGLGTVEVTQLAGQDVFDADGSLVHHAAEAREDDDGNPLVDELPLIDEDFGTALFDASDLPNDRGLRIAYDTRKIPYNPDGKDRDKRGSYRTVADFIQADWVFPRYECQRPAGAYMVDTAPVNTMVLAITRAGKGQTYIEPMIDMWSRETRPNNMVVNDPKGELLVKNYVPLVLRGFEPVQFNLINAVKTDIYNPLGMAADAARAGDSTKCAQYVENIAEVFFPVDGSEDPVWPNAANNAFKRAAYGLIDFYLEEERELREVAVATGMDPAVLEQKLDDLWGTVTLYNCYQLFVELTSKKLKNPEAELEARIKAGEFDDRADDLEAARETVAEQVFLWEHKPEQDLLTLYFNATEALPRNTMRTLIANADNALRAMAGAEKMLASVYGIAITAMSFFADPTISTLTSGKPSQNTDLGGLSFPRRCGVRFAADYVKRNHLVGLRAVWSAYGDAGFTQDLGDDFAHADLVSREGWAYYYFRGIFPTDQAWIKLELINPQSTMLVRTFYFQFTKNYQLSLSGRHFVVEPVTGEKLIKNGVLRELRPVTEPGNDGSERIIGYRSGEVRYPHSRLDFSGPEPQKVTDQGRAVIQTMVRYSEQPKAVFLVTPPHLSKYAKLILILIKQLVDLNFDKSYMTKSNQKPLYKTRFMLDELGNLQSDGHGIAGFETMLSIGLGQEQQFTIILQTLQQLRDVYGESVDRIVQGNAANIIFLKSTDDSMIETLEKMSGTTHRTHATSKQITENLDKVVGGTTEGAISRTWTTEEKPLISYNDLAFLPPRNSIVFRAGNPPIWNRNQTILPMSWRLLKDRPAHPGHEYSLQTIPTRSTAIDFDVRRNQPDFRGMLDKRIAQAVHASKAQQLYQSVNGFEDVDIVRLDPDVYADEVMAVVGMLMAVAEGRDPHDPALVDPDDFAALRLFDDEAFVDNALVAQEIAERRAQQAERQALRYAEGTISQEMLINGDGSAKLKSLDRQIVEAYRACQTELERDHHHFSVGGNGEVRSVDGAATYLTRVHSRAFTEAARQLGEAVEDPISRVFAGHDVTDDLRSLESTTVHAAFYQYLASLPRWTVLASGAFDRAMAIEMTADD